MMAESVRRGELENWERMDGDIVYDESTKVKWREERLCMIS